jgi:hypothetical protein
VLYIFKIVSVLTFLQIVLLIVPINCKNVANLNSTSLEDLVKVLGIRRDAVGVFVFWAVARLWWVVG